MINFDLEFKDLESFVALYNYQNFTKAAEKLCIIQSALSRRIKDLEDELGVELIKRAGPHIQITDAGRKLYKESVRLMREKDALYTDMNRFRNGEAGGLRIAADPIFDLNLILKGIEALSAELPFVQISFECNYGLDLVRYVKEGAVDLIFAHIGTVENIPRLKNVVLAKNSVRVGVGRLHRFYNRSSVSWSELSGEKLVNTSISNNVPYEKIIKQGVNHGAVFGENLAAKTAEETLGYVTTGKYICFGGDIGPLITAAVSDYIKFIPVLEGENVIGWPAVSYLESNDNPLIHKFLEVYNHG